MFRPFTSPLHLLPLLTTALVGLATTQSAQAAVVANGTVDETTPVIAYSTDDDEFLVVWQALNGFGGADLLARRFDGAGTPTSGPFVVAASAFYNERNPAVAYNPVTKGFFVAYEQEDGQDTDIRIAEVTRTGTIVLQPLDVAVATDTRHERAPRLAYNSTANAFIVSYELEYSSTDSDIYAVRVHPSTGAVTGTPLGVQTTGADAHNPDVACSWTAATCVVVDDETGSVNTDIHSRSVDLSTWSLGSSYHLTTALSQPSTRPSIEADDAGKYMVAWEYAYGGSDNDVYARPLAANGSSSGARLTIAGSGRDEQHPDVAFIDSAARFYVVWENEGPNTANDLEIWSRPVRTFMSLEAPRRVAYTAGKDNLAPAVALSGDFPDIGMAVWEHVFAPGSLGTPRDTDIHIAAVLSSDA